MSFQNLAKSFVLSLFVFSVLGYTYPPKGALPNIGYLGLGYDALEGLPFPSSLRYPVIDVSYYNNWTIGISGIRYTFPDQVVIVPHTSSDTTPHAEVFTSATDLQKSLTTSISSDYEDQFIEGMYGNSNQAAIFNEQFAHSNFSAFTNYRVTSWKASFNTKNVTSFFYSAVEQLPSTYNTTTCSDFENFIKNFGTHYVNQAMYGGTISMISNFTISNYNSEGEAAVALDLETQLSLLQLGASASTQQQQQLQQLNAKYSSVAYLVGGKATSYSVGEWEEWASTVSQNALPISVDLPLLSEIVPSELSSKKSALELAIRSYLSRGWPSGWSVKAPMQYPYEQLTATTTNGIIYAFGGISSNNEVPSTLSAYDPSTNTWSSKGNFPGKYAIWGIGSTAVNGIIYAMGGEDYLEHFYSTNYAYNPQTNTWSTKTILPQALAGASLASINEMIYLIGGYVSKVGEINSVWQYNTTSNRWTYNQMSPMSINRAYTSSIVMDGIIYTIGGSTSYNTYTGAVEAYNPTTNKWTTKASMPTARQSPILSVQNGLIYAISGLLSYGGGSNAIETYDPVTNVWTKLDPVPSTYSINGGVAGATVGDLIYMMGGTVANMESFLPGANVPMNCS